MNDEIKARENFYANEMNYDRMADMLEKVAKQLTLAEALKMIREISYDMVYYNDSNNCGIIYRDANGKYTQQNREEACQLQRFLCTACDLFQQSIVDKRVFGDYLNHWLNGGAMERQIEELKERIKELEEQVE